MTAAEAKRLGWRVERDDRGCRVLGRRLYVGGGARSYAVEVLDTRTGVTFVLNSTDDWVERCN